MQKLRDAIQKFRRWSPLTDYINRIESYRDNDFSLCVENAKALLESVAKEICKQQKQPLTGNESVNKVLGLAFGALGYPPSGVLRQIATAVANIGQQMGNFRNEVGTTSHGKTLEEIEQSRNSVETFTGNFLMDSTELLACFLIEAIESKGEPEEPKSELRYEENEAFNNKLDEEFGSFKMGELSFLASEILFNNDPKAYRDELSNFKPEDDETDN